MEPPIDSREPPIEPIEPPGEPIEPPGEPIEPPEEPIEPPGEPPIEPIEPLEDPELPPEEGVETGGPPDGEETPPVVWQAARPAAPIRVKQIPEIRNDAFISIYAPTLLGQAYHRRRQAARAPFGCAGQPPRRF